MNRRLFSLCLAAGTFVSLVAATANSASAIEQRFKQCTCQPQYDYRLADPQDWVCVDVNSRALIARENDEAARNRISETDNRCKSGFVWRDAFDGDGVCVTPEARDRVHQENQEQMKRIDICPN